MAEPSAANTRTHACNPARHNPALDGLRGVAILLVLLTHGTVIRAEGWLESAVLAPMTLGWCGVDLFFVLSGFLITGILLDQRGAQRGLRAFYARRVLRIVPLYYALLVATFVLLPMLSHPKQEEFVGYAADQWWYWSFLSNFLMASRGDFGHPLLAVTWSLAIEEQFYLFWPLIVAAAGGKGLRIVCPALVIGSLACRLTLMYGYEANSVALYTLTPCRLDGLAVGAWIAALVQDGFQPARYAKPAAMLLTTAYAPVLVSEAIHLHKLNGQAYAYSTFACTLGFSLLAVASGAALILALSHDSAPRTAQLLRWPVLQSFGKYSYGIYLLHLPVRGALRDYALGPGGESPPWLTFPHAFGSPLLAQLLYYPLVFAVCWGVGWLSWRAIEQPFLRLKKRFPYPAAPPTAGKAPQP